MTIWRIRYEDVNGQPHAIFHEQSLKPGADETIRIIQWYWITSGIEKDSAPRRSNELSRPTIISIDPLPT